VSRGQDHTGSYQALLADLAAEQRDLDGIVSGLGLRQWATATPADGWAVRDQIFHLAHYDMMGVLAMRDVDRFVAERDAALSDPVAYEAEHIKRAALLSPPVQLQDWRDARTQAQAELSVREPGDRITWFGPSMSAMSFATARLMEVWAHGQDIVDALAVPRAATDRIFHVAHLGFLTRSWSFAVRGLTPPEFDVVVDLIAPSGTPWTWGTLGATQSVRGKAVDFALVVSQRRALADTDLVIIGAEATRWMQLAQAFAGGPGKGREAGVRTGLAASGGSQQHSG
jgi:uncharacterized protein (TIGR03084 family)